MKRLRARVRGVATRLRRHGGSVLAAAMAAAVAYAVAAVLLGPENSFFAPIAAVIIVGLSGGQRLQRSAEVTGGVLIGVVAGELVSLLALPTPVALGLAVALGMGAAVAVRATSLFTNQAAVATVVTMVLVPITQAPPFARLADAVVGGVVALLFAVLTTLRPERQLGRAVVAAMGDLADSVVDVSQGLRDPASDLDAAVRRTIDATGFAATLDDAVRAARESMRLGRRRRELARVRRRVTQVRDEWLHLAASLASLARAARAIRRAGGAKTDAASRVADLAEAIRRTGRWAARGDESAGSDAIREELTVVGHSLTRDLGDDPPASERVLYVSARSAVVDLLRMTGLSHSEAVAIATSDL